PGLPEVGDIRARSDVPLREDVEFAEVALRNDLRHQVRRCGRGPDGDGGVARAGVTVHTATTSASAMRSGRIDIFLNCGFMVLPFFTFSRRLAGFVKYEVVSFCVGWIVVGTFGFSY